MEHVFHKPLAFRKEEDIRKDLRDTIYSITQNDQSQHFQLPDTQARVPTFQLPDTQQTRVPVFQLPDTQTERFQAQEPFDINHNYAKITFVILIIVVIVLIYFNIKLYIKQTRLEAIINSMFLQNMARVF